METLAETPEPVATDAYFNAADTSEAVPYEAVSDVEPEVVPVAAVEIISPEPIPDDAETDVAVADVSPAEEEPAAPAAFVAPEPVAFVTPAFAASPVVDPFPPMVPAAQTIIPNFEAPVAAFSHAPSLELTPPEQDTAPVVRPVWGEAERQAPVPDQEPLFEDDSGLVSVLRHEEPDVPQRFDWSQTGAFAIMGGVGLVAAVSSAAAFRLSIESPSPMGETTIVAWTLAVIGGVCVVVSVWNLYPRLFPAKGE
jgi:lysozyme